MHEFFYQGVWRMDWGFGNPNKTAALIGMLMVASWFLTFLRNGFWPALVCFTALGICLILTFSRGGMIALVAGMTPILVCAPRPWPHSRIGGVLIAIGIMVAFMIPFKAEKRYVQGVVDEDRSIANRLTIWSAAPRMMWDAPSGWGLGNSGEAYMQWYQPLQSNERYRTLVNSHLTWLVELGWPARVLYLAGWSYTFLLCWPNRRDRCASLVFGVWIAFAVSAAFSSVAESPWLWILPGLGLMLVLVRRAAARRWPRAWLWPVPLLGSILLLALFVVAGREGSSVHCFSSGVVLGGGPPRILLMIDAKVLGRNYGHVLRKFLSSVRQPPCIAVMEAKRTRMTFGCPKIVFAGRMILDGMIDFKGCATREIILLNPSCNPSEISLPKDDDIVSKVYFGEFSQSPAVEAWKRRGKVIIESGAGEYLPNWTALAISSP